MIDVSVIEALTWEGPRQMAVRTVARPRATRDEVVLRVDAAGICGSEIEGYLGRQGNRTPPLIMGHEFAGTVIELGPGVDPSWSGARVAVDPLLSCGHCPPCLSGHRNACERRQLIGIHRPGGFAAQTAVPASALLRLPDGLDARLGALAEPLANGVHAVRLGIVRGAVDDAVVIGAGTIGLAALQAATAAGIARVTVVEPHAGRRAHAGTLGAHATLASVDELPRGAAPLVIDAVGRAETRVGGIAATRAAGTLVAIGLHDDRTEVSFHDLIRREVAVQASYAYSDEDFARALDLLATGRAGIGSLEPILPLAAGPRAFAELAQGASEKIKVFLSGNA